MGLIAIGGSVVPLLLDRNLHIAAASEAALACGIALMGLGLMICARAGTLKSADPSRSTRSIPFGMGLFYCVAAGVLSALVNFALVFGAPIAQPAIARGVNPATANNAVWAIVFTVNYLVNIGYCLFRASRARSLAKFRSDSNLLYWFLAAIMGLLWAGGIVAYGHGASMEGPLGPVFGFPIMLVTSILTGNAAGALMGEWRHAPLRARSTMRWGVCVMVLAIVTLGFANHSLH
jgi:L-rhamnose-H+ transport protein